MIHTRPFTVAGASLITLMQAGCTDSVTLTSIDNDSSIDNDTAIELPTTDNTTLGHFNQNLFGDTLLSVGEEICTLDDGSETNCMRLVFEANGAGSTDGDGTIGPYCPESLTTPRNEAGFGSYDGPTTPGFLPLVDAAIAMDADGYDIVDINGNINSDNLTGTAAQDASYCLQPGLDDGIELTYLIPITPQPRTEPWDVGTVDNVGVGVLGVPYKGNPPSVTTVEAGVGGTGSGNIPSLDHCGGHPDPFGYYHWHLIPQGTNTVLASDTYRYTQDHGISCSNRHVDFDNPEYFAGLAKDGFPLYGPADSVNGVAVAPTEVATLDTCNGHLHATDDFPDGVYHYHALDDQAPNLPPCLIGKFVENDTLINGGAVGGGPGGGPDGGPDGGDRPDGPPTTP